MLGILSDKKRISRAVEYAVLTILFLFMRGYQFGDPTQSAFIPSMYHMSDPSFLANDWYMQALVPYHYLFKLFYVWCMQWTSLEMLFFISYMVSLFLFLWGTRTMSRALFKTDRVFYVALPFLFLWDIVSGDPSHLVQSNVFTSGFLANALALCACAFLFSRRYIYACVVVGVISWVHIGIAMNTAAIVVGYYCVSIVVRVKMPHTRIVIGLLTCAALCAYPLMVSIHWGNGFAEQVLPRDSSMLFLRHMSLRAPHHFFASTWRGTIVEFLFTGLLAMAIICTRCRFPRQKQLGIFVITILIGYVVQFFCIEIMPAETISQCLFYRMGVFVSFAALLYTAYFLTRALRTRASYASALCASCVMFSGNVLTALCALVPITYRRVLSVPTKVFLLCVAIIPVVFGILWCRITGGSVAYFLERFGVGMHSVVFVSVGVITLCLMKYFRRYTQKHFYTFPVVTLVVIAVVQTLLPLQREKIAIAYAAHSEWDQVCDWVREHTAPEASFIVPPYVYRFHLRAQRREFVNFKVSLFLKKDIMEWEERLKRVLTLDDLYSPGVRGWAFYPFMQKRYARLTEADVISIAEDYAFDYIICEKPHILTFPLIKQTPSYSIYKIQR